MDANDNTFWKATSRAVPGRPSPKKLETHRSGSGRAQHGAGGSGGGGGGSSSFQDFQQSCSDAWDMGDDEFCIISSGMNDGKISKRASQSAALSVLQIHRNNSVKQESVANHTASATSSSQSPNPLHSILTSKCPATSSTSSSSPTSTTSSVVHVIGSSASEDQPQKAAHNPQYPNPTNPPSEPSAAASSLHVDTNCDRPTSSHPSTTSSTAVGGAVVEPKMPCSGDARPPAFRAAAHFPGRPQLIRLSSNSLCRTADHESKVEKFQTLLDAPLLNQIALKELSFSGVPARCRAITWRLLSGYLPTSHERRAAVLERKRLDYQNLLAQYFHSRDSRDESQQDTFHQIHIDVPRMNPQVQLFQQELVQEMFERVLFIWAIRHPASGYVQGINDLVTPFFIVFLQEALGDSDTALDTFTFARLTVEQRNIIEADAFWCLTKFMDCIQDNYIFAQLGIQAKVNQLKELIQRIDAPLHRHLHRHGVDYLQFSFRWMNNLLTRELPLHCTIRLWDTYLAESDGFAVFQLYVCAAFLLHWRDQLVQEQDFQGLLLLLQNLPTHNWADSHIGILVAEAYRLKFTYADAPKHLEGKS